MKTVLQYFLNRSLLVNLISVMIIITGIVSVYLLQKELFPSVSFDIIVVTTAYPGSSPEDVEKLVTIPIEREVKSVDGIEELNAISLEGVSILYLKIDPDIDADDVLTDVREAVDAVNDLPDEAKVPRIVKPNNQLMPIIKFAIYGGEESTMRNVAKKLRDRLELISDVAKVNLDGYRDGEIRVEVDPHRMNKYEITIDEIVSAIKDRNINLSAGKLETKVEDINIRVLTEFKNSIDISKVVIRSNRSGQQIRVSDVAKVNDTYADARVLQRIQGQRAIILDVIKREKSDILKSTKEIKKIVDSFFEFELSQGLLYRHFDDTSFYVKRRLGVLTNNGFLGLFLVFLCLMMFLNFRASIITSLGAPIAFMIAFATMDMFGVSINLVSLFGLIMVLGLLVDDSIIVAEHYYQHLEKGVPPYDAALRAANETFKPVLATVLTTIVAFGALYFMDGIMGKFLWSIPTVIIICLVASLIECFFILPSHLKDFVRIKPGSINKKRWYDSVIKVYKKVLDRSLKYYWAVCLVFLLVFISSVYMAFKMDFELFPGDDVRIIYANITGDVGTPLGKTSLACEQVENLIHKHLKKDVELKHIRTIVGLQWDERKSRNGTHYGTMLIYLTTPDMRKRTTDQLINILDENFKESVNGFKVEISKIQHGPPKGKPVEIEIMGESLNELQEKAGQIKDRLDQIDGVTGIKIDYEEGKKQLLVEINDSEAKRLGLSIRKIAYEIRKAYAGDEITEIRKSDEDINIVVQFDKKALADVKSIENIYVLNNFGQRIKLTKIAKIRQGKGSFVIRRFNKKRTIAISAEVDKKKTNSLKVNRTMQPFMDNIIKNNPHLDYILSGEHKDTNTSMQGLKRAALVALFCIFVILVAMFSSLGMPIVIMSTIPLGLIGVILTFKLMGVVLSFMALLGVIGLIGVVVNDSIVLVNFINKKTKEIPNLIEAISMASVKRFRPVILTTFTTVAGLLPIAHSNGGDPFLKPMALSFAYGLLFSTCVTLIFTPCAYMFYTKLRSFIYRKLKLSDNGVTY